MLRVTLRWRDEVANLFKTLRIEPSLSATPLYSKAIGRIRVGTAEYMRAPDAIDPMLDGCGYFLDEPRIKNDEAGISCTKVVERGIEHRRSHSTEIMVPCKRQFARWYELRSAASVRNVFLRRRGARRRLRSDR